LILRAIQLQNQQQQQKKEWKRANQLVQINFMTNKNHAVWLNLLLIAGLALAGCGKGKSGSGAGGFESASPGIKAAWDRAVADDKANNYAPAVMGYKQILLQRDQLSPDQVKAAEEASGKLYQRLVEAAGKGDPAASQALTALNARFRGKGLPR
jgi:hypothetical protein